MTAGLNSRPMEGGTETARQAVFDRMANRLRVQSRTIQSGRKPLLEPYQAQFRPNSGRLLQPTLLAASDGFNKPVALASIADRVRPTVENASTAKDALPIITASLPVEKPNTSVQGRQPNYGLRGQGGPLARLQAKLQALKSGQRTQPVTILHIGDSHVASDSFSQGIRRKLQAEYGNAGRGAVIPAGAFKYGFIDQAKMTRSGNWRSHTALRQRKGRYGISGVSVSSRSSRASMKMTVRNGEFDWASVTVATGPSQGSVVLKVGDTTKRFDAHASKKGSKTFQIKAKGSVFEVRPGGGAQTTVLNWATGRNTPGIRYINFGLIGATVNITKRFNPQLVANDIRAIKPDLIVYGFGTNEGFNDNLNLARYASYAKGWMGSLLDAAPQADVVYMGAASGLRRRNGQRCGSWAIPKKMKPLRQTVKEVAAAQNGAYWDWSKAMGGDCAVNSWAGKGLAARDRVHLTSKGYRRSAAYFVDWLTAPERSNRVVALNQ
ncbi:MAG: GDSL-type esterase/lipase family protein [Pseudomonadota bacterium]